MSETDPKAALVAISEEMMRTHSKSATQQFREAIKAAIAEASKVLGTHGIGLLCADFMVDGSYEGIVRWEYGPKGGALMDALKK